MMNYDFESEEEGRESSAVEDATKNYGIRVVICRLDIGTCIGNMYRIKE